MVWSSYREISVRVWGMKDIEKKETRRKRGRIIIGEERGEEKNMEGIKRIGERNNKNTEQKYRGG